MDNNFIRTKVSEVLTECNVKYFPFDCFQILLHYGYKIYTYSELEKKNHELYKMCISYSQDAFRVGHLKLIAYNEKKPASRIRFSLMHELGHHILEHKSDTPENEAEANYFASNILAPRLAMYYAKLKSVQEVADLFGISTSAAYYAAQDFSEWCQETKLLGMHSFDQMLYRQFYNTEFQGFVYSLKTCEFCGANVYNEKKPYCRFGCKLPEPQVKKRFGALSADDACVLRRLENNWLYNF